MRRLKIIRKQKGLSQSELANILGVSQNTVSQWESGDRSPSISILKQLTTILECSADILLEDVK